MRNSGKNLAKAFGVAILGVAVCVGAIYVGELDDAPGASLMGILLMLGAFVLAFRIARRQSSPL